MTSVRWGADTWRVFAAGEARNWVAHFPPEIAVEALVEWQRRVLWAGEETAAYRLRSAERFGYDRARHGYVGDYLRARPGHPTDAEGATIPGVIFDQSYEAVATTRLTIHATDGTYVEVEVSNLADAAAVAGLKHRPDQQPIFILGAAGWRVDGDWDPYRFDIEIGCSIWFPWGYEEGGTTSPERVIDNRPLAQLNAPRLNTFLAAAREATESLGGTWRFDGGTAFERCQLGDDGVDLDAVPSVGVVGPP